MQVYAVCKISGTQFSQIHGNLCSADKLKQRDNLGFNHYINYVVVISCGVVCKRTFFFHVPCFPFGKANQMF